VATNRIVKFGLEEDAGRLAADPEMNPGKIAVELSRISGQQITRATVLRYFKTNADPVQKRAAQREEIVARAITERLDTAAQLRTINERAIRILDNTEAEDPRTAILALREIREQLALQAKLLGDLPADGAVTINILQNPIFAEFQTIVEGVMCDDCRQRLRDRLRQVLGP
jgi:hypothetical protein